MVDYNDSRGWQNEKNSTCPQDKKIFFLHGMQKYLLAHIKKNKKKSKQKLKYK